MPEHDETAIFDEQMQAFFTQLDVVRESWQHFIDAEGALKAATKTWPVELVTASAQRGATASGKPISFAASSDFVPIDAALADASRAFDAYCAGVQVMQSAFDQAMKIAESGADLGSHSEALGAAIKGVPEIVAQSTAAQAAWTQGMAAFMPRYRKAKLETIERTANARQQR